MFVLWPLLAPTPAQADVQTRASETGVLLFWPRPCVRLNLLLGSRPEGMSEELFRSAANEAAAVWSSSRISCTKMFVSVSGSFSSSRYVENDRVNAIQFRTDFWGRNAKAIDDRVDYPRNALAITSVFANRTTGVIVDTDVEINNKGPQWGDVVANPQLLRSNNAHDLQNTLTHEFGHVVGLDHTCDGGGQSNLVDHRGQAVQSCPGPLEVQETTMAAIVEPGDVHRRTLAADDELAMCQMYPADGQPACSADGGGNSDGDSDGGCMMAASSGKQRPGAVPVIAALTGLALWWARRRRRNP